MLRGGRSFVELGLAFVGNGFEAENRAEGAGQQYGSEDVGDSGGDARHEEREGAGAEGDAVEGDDRAAMAEAQIRKPMRRVILAR